MIILNLVVVLVSLVYHLLFIIGSGSAGFYPPLSLALSASVCLAGVLYGGLKEEILYPPRVLAILYLVFYPVFAAIYLVYPDVGKWYHLHFSLYSFTEDVAWTVFYVTITLPIFLLGFYWGQNNRRANQKKFDASNDKLPEVRINIVMALATFIGVVGMLHYANSLGGIGYMTEMMGDIAERKSWRGEASLTYYPGMFLMTAPSICLLAALYDPVAVKKKSLVIGLSLLALALPVLVLTQAAREKALIPILLVLMSMHYFKKRRRAKAFRITKKSLILAIFVLVFGIMFLVHSQYRHQEVASRPLLIQLISDFNRIDVSVVMYHDFLTGHDSYLYGKPFLSYVVQPFVRLFGVEPIPSTSALLGQSIFPSEAYGNPGAPLAGELYLNFGFLGYLFFLSAGFLFAKAYSALYKSHFEFWTTLFYVLWVYLFMFKFCIQIGISESLLFAGLLVGQVWLLRQLCRVRVSGGRRSADVSAPPGSLKWSIR